MKKTQKLLIVTTSIIAVILATTFVTATPRILSTPLFVLRMEHASSTLDFLPTNVNGFTYTTEKGHTLTCNVEAYEENSSGATAAITYGDTCPAATCPNTCQHTCVSTCETCVSTCQSTCVSTCHTCASTCPQTCIDTCPATCWTCKCPCPIR